MLYQAEDSKDCKNYNEITLVIKVRRYKYKEFNERITRFGRLFNFIKTNIVKQAIKGIVRGNGIQVHTSDEVSKNN